MLEIIKANQVFFGVALTAITTAFLTLIGFVNTYLMKRFVDTKIASIAADQKNKLDLAIKSVDIKINEAKGISELVRSELVGKWSRRDDLIFSAVVQNTELLWDSYQELSKFSYLAQIVASLDWSEVKIAMQSHPDKMTDFAELTMGIFSTPDSFKVPSIGRSDLYIDEEIMLIYGLKYSICMHAFVRMQSVRLQTDIKHYIDFTNYQNTAIKALPMHEEYIRTLGHDKYFYLLELCDIKFRFLARNLLKHDPARAKSDISHIVTSLNSDEIQRMSEAQRLIERYSLSVDK